MTLKRIKALGRGGFGNVDLVEDADGRVYARKTFSINQPSLPPTLVENVKRRFVREAKVQTGLSHKNIVPIVGGDLSADPPFFLMPAAEASLADDIAQDRQLGGHWKAAVVDVVTGLEELHSLGMCHRDLKPQNVLRFAQDDPTDRASYYAIGDFGFISLKDSRFSALTRTGMARGSDFYTAPEIVADLRNASPLSDVYSLGCIIHDIVGRSDRVPCNEIKEEGPFAAILLSCTRQDQKRRFKSARSVADALLSIEEESEGPATAQGETFAAALDGTDPLTADLCRGLVEYLDVATHSHDKRVILLKLTSERIEEICLNFPGEANKLGGLFARWVHDSSFNFDTCDVLSDRLETFHMHGSFDVKVDCLLAMLRLGTSHNRWYAQSLVC